MFCQTEEDAFNYIQSTPGLLAIDIETTGLNKRKDKIFGIGIGNSNSAIYIDCNKINPFNILRLLRTRKLITWNGAFDLPFIKNVYNVDLVPMLKADVMLLKHTTDEEFPFGLKECATKEFGIDAKSEQIELKEHLKSIGASPKEFYKADSAIIGKYCMQDCMLTARLFDIYMSRAIKENTLTFFDEEVMQLYRWVTIPMENQGIKLDIEKLKTEQTNIAKDIAQLEHNIQMAIAPHLSLFATWYLNKEYPWKTSTGKPSAWTKKHNTQMDAWAAEATGYMFNLQSKHHLKKLFFDTLGCEPLSRTPTGLPQVDDDFIQSVKDTYSWAGELTMYNKLNKLKSTYIDSFLEEAEDGIFYPSFLQHRTVSGRYASDFQQLPRPVAGDDLVSKYTSLIRTFIIPRSGHTLVSADYAQLEPTIFAHVSNDRALQAIFHNNMDFYSEVAIKTERLSGVSSDKNAPNYLGKVNKEARQKAKAYSLGLAYGMTAYKLKFEINCSEEEATKLVNDYYSAFPELKKLIDNSIHQLDTLGYVTTQSGRVRHLTEAKRIYEKYGPDIKNDLHLWKTFHGTSEYLTAKEARKVYKNSCNNAINFQIQGLAASIVNQAAIKLAKKGLLPIAQIHDELVFDIADDQLYWALDAIKEVMESIMKLSVPLKADPQTGDNYAKCK